MGTPETTLPLSSTTVPVISGVGDKAANVKIKQITGFIPILPRYYELDRQPAYTVTGTVNPGDFPCYHALRGRQGIFCHGVRSEDAPWSLLQRNGLERPIAQTSAARTEGGAVMWLLRGLHDLGNLRLPNDHERRHDLLLYQRLRNVRLIGCSTAWGLNIKQQIELHELQEAADVIAAHKQGDPVR